MKSDHERVADVGNWKNKLLYISTFITFLLTLNEKYGVSKTHTSLKDYIDVIIGLNAVLILIYIVLDVRENYLFSRAERGRVFRYIDNSFDTNFAERKIENYFSQDYINPGFYKMCVNCFENTYFTYNIAKQMQISAYIKAGVVLTIFMFSATVGDKGLVRYITEAILPLAFLQNALRLSWFVASMDSLRETFASFFNSIKDTDFKGREPEALKNVITYEKTLAWASIQLEKPIYDKLNPKLSEEWEEMKRNFNIRPTE